MPRKSGGMRSSGFGGFRKSGPSSRSGTTVAVPPARSISRYRSPSIQGGLGSTIMQGMAFGAGSEIGHSAVRGTIGGHSYRTQPYQDQSNQLNTDPCRLENESFLNCLKNNPSDIGACQSVLDLFKQCRGQV